MLVSRFFRVYTLWCWPNPVMLCSIEEDKLGFSIWDPRKNPRDRSHHMPIITPAYPCMNSSYNVSVSTLRVMMDQFQFGNKICEEIELNKAQWSALFEPYFFFESYKNYLQVDIVAIDADDLRAWKGWIESRLRQLTLMIERDTYGKLQCHPYPHDYVDTSRQCSHCAFFMGLQRKQGEVIQEGQQFDIRSTVDEFRHSVNMYMFWKPGMEIHVSHVRRKQIPSYVFPEGYRRTRPPRITSEQHAENSSRENGEVCRSGSGERRRPKRKRDSDGVQVKGESPEKNQSVSPDRRYSMSPEIFSHSFVSAPKDCFALASERIRGSPDGGTCQVGVVDAVFNNSNSVEIELTKGVPFRMEDGEEASTDLAKSERERLFAENAKAGCLLNSSVVANLAREISSCEDIGLESVAGSSEDNGCDNGGGLLQDGLLEECEPNAALGVVLKSRGGVNSESTVTSMMSLTSTA